MERKDSYSHILKYTGLFGGVQGLGILVSILRTKLVAVILGPQGVGLISLFNSTIKLIGDGTTFGLSMSGVKAVSEAYETGDEVQLRKAIRQVRSFSLLTALLGTVVCVALSPLLSRYTFSWEGNIFHFICLAPAVGLTALMGGETAVLKGTRQLRGMAVVSIYSLLASLLLSIPIFYLFGDAGIVPSIVLVALVQMLLMVGYSFRRYPLEISLRRHVLASGASLLMLGIGVVLANVMNSGAELLIKSYINNVAQIEELGLYNAGFMMTMTYAGMVFSAMETDYFPRLAGINGVGEELNQTVNRQIEVSLLLVAPLLVGFMIGLPIIIPLLYSTRFLPAIGLVQVLILAMYLRALKLPLAYLPLAKGHPWSYLLMEGICAVTLATLTIVFFHFFGLTGAGIGILLNAVFDFFMLNIFMHYRYGYVISAAVLKYAALQLPIGLMAYALTFVGNPWVYWPVGILLGLLSLSISLYILHRKSRLWKALKEKMVRKA